jgi:hypothetical protein
MRGGRGGRRHYWARGVWVVGVWGWCVRRGGVCVVYMMCVGRIALLYITTRKLSPTTYMDSSSRNSLRGIFTRKWT